MKKLIKGLLLSILFFGLTLNAHAEVGPYEDMATIELKKAVAAQGVNPAETFNFEVIDAIVLKGSAEEAPALANFSIPVAQGAALGTINLTLPTFDKVGTYQYFIQEIEGNTAGMTYDLDVRHLIVQVFKQDGDLVRIAYLTNAQGEKLDDFILANNEFKAGNLHFKKVLAGNFTDPDDEFKVTVTLTKPAGKTLQIAPMAADGAHEAIALVDDKIILTYTVKGGSEFTIENIPYGVMFNLVEEDTIGFDPAYLMAIDHPNGTINALLHDAIITNTRNVGIITGVHLDNLPYFLTLGFVALGFVAVKRRKRHA